MAVHQGTMISRVRETANTRDDPVKGRHERKTMKGLMYSAALVMLATPGIMAQQENKNEQDSYGRYVLWLTDEDIEQLKSNPVGLASKIPERLRGQIGEVVIRYQPPTEEPKKAGSTKNPIKTNKPQNEFPGQGQPGANDRVANSNRYNSRGSMLNRPDSNRATQDNSVNQTRTQNKGREQTFEERLAEMQSIRGSSNSRRATQGEGQPADWRANQNATGFDPNFDARSPNNSVLDRPNRQPVAPRTGDFDAGTRNDLFRDQGNRRPQDEADNQRRMNELDRQIQLEKTRTLEAQRLAVERARNNALLAEIEKQREELRKEEYLRKLREENRTYVENDAYKPSGFDPTLTAKNEFGPVGTQSSNSIDYSPRRVGQYGRQLLDYQSNPSPPRERTASLPKSGNGVGEMTAMIPANRGTVPVNSTIPSNGRDSNVLAERNNVTDKTNGFLWFMLLCSVGMNVYLSWIARGFYMRYNELADELRETFTATM